MGVEYQEMVQKTSKTKLIMKMSADTSGYKGVVPGRQEMMRRTNKNGQPPVRGIRPMPCLCQLAKNPDRKIDKKQINTKTLCHRDLSYNCMREI